MECNEEKHDFHVGELVNISLCAKKKRGRPLKSIKRQRQRQRQRGYINSYNLGLELAHV